MCFFFSSNRLAKNDLRNLIGRMVLIGLNFRGIQHVFRGNSINPY